MNFWMIDYTDEVIEIKEKLAVIAGDLTIWGLQKVSIERRCQLGVEESNGWRKRLSLYRAVKRLEGLSL